MLVSSIPLAPFSKYMNIKVLRCSCKLAEIFINCIRDDTCISARTYANITNILIQDVSKFLSESVKW